MKNLTIIKRKNLAFTLAEVLITLVIIGVIAAMTVPSLLQSTQDKEYHSKLRKNISVIKQAFNLAQVEEGMMGDNAAIVSAYGDLTTATFKSAAGAGLSKYITTAKSCTTVGDTLQRRCEEKEIENLKKQWNPEGWIASYLWLADGTIYGIDSTLGYYLVRGLEEVPDTEEAIIYIDVNGEKKPNKWGKDIYMAYVTPTRIDFYDNVDKEKTKNMQNILLGK